MHCNGMARVSVNKIKRQCVWNSRISIGILWTRVIAESEPSTRWDLAIHMHVIRSHNPGHTCVRFLCVYITT